MDFSRPTNSGITMCGYTTTSRSGSTGTADGTTASITVVSSVTVALGASCSACWITAAAVRLTKKQLGRPASFQDCVPKTQRQGQACSGQRTQPCSEPPALLG